MVNVPIWASDPVFLVFFAYERIQKLSDFVKCKKFYLENLDRCTKTVAALIIFDNVKNIVHLRIFF